MPKRKRAHTVAIVAPCIHMPYVLKPAWKLFLTAVEVIKPDVIVINGDGCDFAGIHPKNKDKEAEVKFVEDELKPSRTLIDDLESVLPRQCDCIWSEGNHEHFWKKYHLDKAATSPIAPTWHDALKLGRKWQVLEHEGEEMPSLMLGDLIVAHGTKVRQHSGWTARAELSDRWQSVLIGHTHRLGGYYFTPSKTGVVYEGHEGGCLADQATARKYMKKKPNWQPGFAVVSFDDKNGWFDVSLKKISRATNSPNYRLGLHEGVFTAT